MMYISVFITNFKSHIVSVVSIDSSEWLVIYVHLYVYSREVKMKNESLIFSLD